MFLRFDLNFLDHFFYLYYLFLLDWSFNKISKLFLLFFICTSLLLSLGCLFLVFLSSCFLILSLFFFLFFLLVIIIVIVNLLLDFLFDLVNDFFIDNDDSLEGQKVLIDLGVVGREQFGCGEWKFIGSFAVVLITNDGYELEEVLKPRIVHAE